MSDRLSGRDDVDPLKLLPVLLVGRLSRPSLPGSGPKDKRLIPVVDILETCLDEDVLWSSTMEDVLLLLTPLPAVLLRLRIVTLGGI